MTDDNVDSFDGLLTSIGFGQWQAPIILATVLIAAQLPVHMVGSPLMSAPMPFHCSSTPPAENQSAIHILSYNGSETSYFNSVCLEDRVNITDEEMLLLFADTYNGTGYFTGLPECLYIEYDTSIFTSTVISQWHLVCDKETLRPLFQMLYSAGGLIGSLISGQIGDRFGRRRSVQLGCVGHLASVMVMTCVSSYPVVLIMRIVIGAMMIIMLLPAWSLALEVTPSRNRSLVGMLMGLPYSCFVCIIAGIGYYARTWQYLLLAGAFPGIILFPLAMYIDESPSWLVQRGSVERATKILKNAVRQNKVKLSIPVEATVKKLVETAKLAPEGGAEGKDASKSLTSEIQKMLKYIKSPAMRIILVLSPILWFLQSCLYMSVAINANNFSSSPFLYVALTGVMDASAIILSTPLATRVGRKVMIFTGLFVGAILFLLVAVVSEDYSWVKWVLLMTGFLLLGGSFQVNYIYGPELFPTETRSRGFGFLNLVGNLGYMFSPIVTDVLGMYATWASSVLFGCFGILGSLTIPLLPETLNKPLPETLQDVEDRHKKSKNKSEGKQDGGGKVNTVFEEEKKEEERGEEYERSMPDVKTGTMERAE